MVGFGLMPRLAFGAIRRGADGVACFDANGIVEPAFGPTTPQFGAVLGGVGAGVVGFGLKPRLAFGATWRGAALDGEPERRVVLCGGVLDGGPGSEAARASGVLASTMMAITSRHTEHLGAFLDRQVAEDGKVVKHRIPSEMRYVEY